MQDIPGNIQLPSSSILTTDEFRHLVSKAQAGDDAARAQLIETNLRLAMSIARRFAGRGDMEDIFQVACVGLMKAIDQFDLSYDVRFSTYAVPLMIGEIRKFLRSEGAVKVSRSLKEKAAKAMEAREQLEQQLGRAPTPIEIGKVAGLEREEVVEAMDAVTPVVSIYDAIHEDEGKPVLLEDKLGKEPETDMWLDNYALRQVCFRLPVRERTIVILRFLEEKTQSEVAEALGISQGQVSRLEKRVLELLRESLME